MKICLYLRCSTDIQEQSIERQRKECIKYAKDHGYQVVETYIDEGKSASSEYKKRPAFVRMLADSSIKKFDRILVWQLSRFDRADSIDGNDVIKILRDNKITLESTTDGLTDFTTMEGRIIHNLKQELNHKAAGTIAEGTVSGREEVIDKGFWPYGSVPYGYDRSYYYEGKHMADVSRTAKASAVKVRDWRLKLKVNQEEKKVLDWMYDQILSGKCRGLRSLARLMNEKQIPGPGNKGWTKQSVKERLTDRTYVGELNPGSKRNSRKAKFTKIESKPRKNFCEPIIDQKTFDAVQKIVEKLSKSRPARERHDNGMFSGIVKCGHCGYNMEKRTRKYVDGRPYVVYACASGNKKPGHGCKQWIVREHRLCELVVPKLVESVDRQILERYQHKPNPTSKDDKALEQKKRQLQTQLDRGAKRLVLVDDDLLPALQEELKALKSQINEIETQIGHKQDWAEVHNEEHIAVGRLLAMWDQGKALMLPLAENKMMVLKSLEVRNLLHDLGVKIELYFVPKGRYAELDKGRLIVTGLDAACVTPGRIMSTSA